jgi:hypothetical protein
LDEPILLRPGESLTIDVADLRARFRCDVSFGATLALSGSYREFLESAQSVDLDIRVTSRPELDRTVDPPSYDSGHHWRVHRDSDGVLFEFLHPPTDRVYCHVRASVDFTEALVTFSERAWAEIARAPDNSEILRELPHPLDQLLLIPRMAWTGASVFHAAGVAIDGRAYVFAGHSGDGKTTLARLLEGEGVELLSDERIVIRSAGDAIIAHGTPWPGEGNIVSSASYPLGGLYLVRKSDQHRIAEGMTGDIVGELLARAIVPYYLPDVATRILTNFSALAENARLREIYFARRPGLRELLHNDAGPLRPRDTCEARA